MKNTTLPLLFTLLFTTGLCAQVVDIPDANFKAALVNNPAINTNGDGEIQVVEAEGYEGAVHLRDLEISSLTGIEAFTAIDSLDCSWNRLTSLDVSYNSSLKYLNTTENGFLEYLDLSGNLNLESLLCEVNELTSLDLSSNPNLIYLNCEDNHLTNLDVSSNPVLEYLYFSLNQITSLDVSANLALRILDCGYNQIQHLDLSNNPNLILVRCDENELITLNVQNGNNANMHLSSEENYYLRCIQVDDPEQARDDWHYDTANDAIYSTDCNAEVVYIPDPNFKAALVNNPQINTNGDDEIQITETPPYHGAIMVSGLNILDLTGIESFTRINSLDCSDNQISSLDISENRQLVYLSCSKNQLTGLNVRRLSGLRHLDCSENRLTSLNVKNRENLEYLDCSGNSLTTLNIRTNLDMERLICSNNQLTGLYAAENPGLEYLDCSGNQLGILNVQNGNNINFTHFNAAGNPSLTCVQVDDQAWATTNWANFADPAVSFETDCQNAPIVNIPDPNFKATLLSNPNINTYADDEIQIFEAASYTGAIIVPNRNIESLTGIEVFTAIDSLVCSDNRLDNLNLSGNPGLVYLDCARNKIRHLDLSMNPVLESLNGNTNLLASLDVSSNQALNKLICSSNLLSSLNVQNGNNVNMVVFEANSTPNLDCIQVDDPAWAAANWSTDIGPNTTFSTDCPPAPVVYIPDANFKVGLAANPSINLNGDDEIQVVEAQVYEGAIDVSGLNIASLTGVEAFAAISSLDCSNNALTSLDISNNRNLRGLNCADNQLARLDISVNTALQSLDGQNNHLAYLMASNGNNHNFTYFNATGNAGLTCIEVDDAVWATANWGSQVDPAVAFSTDCIFDIVHIPNANFKAALAGNPAININMDNEIQVPEARAYRGSIEVAGLHISSLTGIEAFPGIESLNCSDNQLSSLFVQDNQDLRHLNCSGNALTHLNVGSNQELMELNCSDNHLKYLYVDANNALHYLDGRNNELEYLNVQNGVNTDFTYFNAIGNPGLTCIKVDDPAWAAANWGDYIDPAATFNTSCAEPVVFIPDNSFKAALLNNFAINTNGDEEIQAREAGVYNGHITVSGLGITSLTGIEAFPGIDFLICSSNELDSLDVHGNPLLKRLFCQDNQLKHLDVSSNPVLERFNCSGNELRVLNARNGNNPMIDFFDAQDNPNLTCIQVDDPDWAAANWRDHVDSIAIFSSDCEAVTSIAQPLEKGTLSVYPNPTTGELTLALGATYPEVTVEVKDVMGRALVRKKYETTAQLDLTLDGPAGLYFVTVRTGNDEFVTVRVVKL